jgi:hypothetical protein
MYIPTTFMSSQGACISASVTSITGSGLITSGTFSSASVLYQYYKFEMSDNNDPALTSFTASLNILSGSTGQAKLLVVGGGGTGADQGAIAAGFTYTVESAGGGGAGGVVYYNQIPIQSGSYQIGIAKAQGTVGSNGYNSYFKLTNNFVYPAFTSSVITAYGGGSGGKAGRYHQNSPSRDFYYTIQPGNGGSGGGGGQVYGGGAQAGGYSVTPNGLTNNYQGNRGGGAEDSGPSTSGAGGGGGSATSGSTPIAPYSSNQAASGNGGTPLSFNLTGTSISVAGGGAGSSYNNIGTNGGGSYGVGGNAYKFNGTNSIPYGTGGAVIIAYPICLSDSDNCKTYTIRGGASGGTITYIPCDTQVTQSTTIDFGYTGSFCTYNVAGYPTSTGTVVLTQTGSCNNFIPIPPTVTCSGGQVKTPLYLWNWATTSQCYPTPTSCQRQYYNSTTIYYTDYQGNSVTQSFGGGFSGGSGQVCARDTPAPTITRGSITKSSTICAYYCSGSI